MVGKAGALSILLSIIIFSIEISAPFCFGNFEAYGGLSFTFYVKTGWRVQIKKRLKAATASNALIFKL